MPKHPHNALSAIWVKKQSAPGRYADGNGLYLLVDDAGAKRWVLRTVIHGKRRDMGLGSAKLVTLADARERAARHRLIARDGGDPIAERRQSSRTVPTFKEAAESVHASHSKAWKNEKHRAQWLSTLKTYAFGELGDKRVNAIGSADVLRVLTPIWLERPETARRVRQRIGSVLDWATAAGHRAGTNPIAGIGKGLPKQKDKAAHLAALPHAAVPAFVKALRESGDPTPALLAFEFLILNASRTGEIIGAHWSEIDEKGALWTIPAERMKAGRVHRVPLSARSLEILKEARKRSGKTYVFPGQDANTPLSNMAFLMTLRRMKVEATTHGFRSAFRDWAAECTNFPREICEAALSHGNKDEVEAAYLRTDFFQKRRKLMGQWAEHVCSPVKGGKVVRMQRSKTAA